MWLLDGLDALGASTASMQASLTTTPQGIAGEAKSATVFGSSGAPRRPC